MKPRQTIPGQWPARRSTSTGSLPPMPAGKERITDKLLPCPFCGSNDVSKSQGRRANGSSWFYIECKSCSACAELDFWNRRATPEAETSASRPAGARAQCTQCGADRLREPCAAAPGQCGFGGIAQSGISASASGAIGVPTMDDALAAGDGTLHGAIDYWQSRALAAEAARDVDETNKVLADRYIELTCAPAAPVGDAELPPLPEPMLEGVDHELWGQNVKSDVWSAEQMRAYARAAQALVRQPGAEVAPLDEAAERARFWAWARAKVSPGLMDAWIAAKRDAAQTAATVPGGEVRKPLTEERLWELWKCELKNSFGSVVVPFNGFARAIERAQGIGATTTSEGGAS